MTNRFKDLLDEQSHDLGNTLATLQTAASQLAGAAQNVERVLTKSVPWGQYIFCGINDTPQQILSMLEHYPIFDGVQIQRRWKDLEPSILQYTFDDLHVVSEGLHDTSRGWGLHVERKAFGDNVLPADLMPLELVTKTYLTGNGIAAQVYDPIVCACFCNLLRTLIYEFDGDMLFLEDSECAPGHNLSAGLLSGVTLDMMDMAQNHIYRALEGSYNMQCYANINALGNATQTGDLVISAQGYGLGISRTDARDTVVDQSSITLPEARLVQISKSSLDKNGIEGSWYWAQQHGAQAITWYPYHDVYTLDKIAAWLMAHH